MDHKVNQLLEEIDLARCRAHWSILVDLSKKYKKHNPEDTVFEITLCTEVELIQVIKSSNDIEKRGWDIIHLHDTPTEIALLPIIDPKKTQHLLKRLSFLNLDQNEYVDLAANDHWQIQFSKILAARIYFESGQYEMTLSVLQNLALRIEDVQTGYGLVLLIQARAVKGISLEKQSNFEAALEAYEAAWHAVELQPEERGAMLSFWIEQCLYRGILLRLRLNHSVQDTIVMMRAYLQLASSHWSPHWRMFRRWIIFKYYADYLVKIYQNDMYYANGTNDTPLEIAAFEELVTLMTLFRNLFTIISPYLTPSAQNEYGMSLAHRMMTSHDVIGWGETNHIRRVLQFLYQVKSVTFNNPTVNRFIFFTLMRLGGLEEAKYALHSYLALIGVPDFDTDIALDDMTFTQNIEAAADHVPEEKDAATEIVSPSSTTIKAQSILQCLPEHADESIESIIQVILAGIYLYGHEEQDGQLAAFLSDLGWNLLKELGQVTSALMVNVSRARGTSYCLLASQCVDPKDRAAHHQTAIASLQKAACLDHSCWKNYYCLGLQQAIMRDTHVAIYSICKSIELNPHHVSSWHLLALLYSCQRTNHMTKAVQTLEAGLNVCSSQQLHAMSGIPVFSWTQDEVNASDVFEKAEAYVSMRMSQIALKEALEGPESALNLYEDLFTTYSQITQQLGLFNTTVAPLPTTDDDISESSNGSHPRTRPRKSSLSLLRRTSLSSLANSIYGGDSSSSIHSTHTQGRPRSSSVEEPKSSRPPSALLRRSESDIDDISDDSQLSRRSSFSRRQKNRPFKPTNARSNSLNIQQQQQQQQLQDAAEIKKRSLQLIDLGLARRIGTAAAAHPSPYAVSQGSHRCLQSSFITEGSQGVVSLASLLTPSYSMGQLQATSVHASSPLFNHRIVTRDGLMISTFHQHHQAFETRKKTRWYSLLVTLWLMATKTYMKAGWLQEANKALSEAEHAGLGDPNVWYQLGQLSLQVRILLKDQQCTTQDGAMIPEMKQVAWDAFEKALILDPDHIPSQVAKATLCLEDQEVDLADGLLETAVLGLGWDSSEAWYALAQVKKHQGRWDRVKTCLLYALELTDTRPVRDLAILPKFIL